MSSSIVPARAGSRVPPPALSSASRERWLAPLPGRALYETSSEHLVTRESKDTVRATRAMSEGQETISRRSHWPKKCQELSPPVTRLQAVTCTVAGTRPACGGLVSPCSAPSAWTASPSSFAPGPAPRERQGCHLL